MFCIMHLCILQPPSNDVCTMLTLKGYDIQINSSKGAIVSTETNNTKLIFLYENSDCHPITELTATLTVVNSIGLYSDPTVKTIVMQSMYKIHIKFINHYE